jgi:hypothetical protein
MNTSYPGNRPVTRRELVEAAIMGTAVLLLTAFATWLGGWVGVPVGWRLAVGVCAAIFIVGSVRLAYYRGRPSWRWWGALVALWAMILLANFAVDVRLW